MRVGIDPDAHGPRLAVDVLVVGFLKDVQCAASPRADEALGVGGDAVNTDLLLFLFIDYTDTGTGSARNEVV